VNPQAGVCPLSAPCPVISNPPNPPTCAALGCQCVFPG
jgi:hypothetical protein